MPSSSRPSKGAPEDRLEGVGESYPLDSPVLSNSAPPFDPDDRGRAFRRPSLVEIFVPMAIVIAAAIVPVPGEGRLALLGLAAVALGIILLSLRTPVALSRRDAHLVAVHHFVAAGYTEGAAQSYAVALLASDEGRSDDATDILEAADRWLARPPDRRELPADELRDALATDALSHLEATERDQLSVRLGQPAAATPRRPRLVGPTPPTERPARSAVEEPPPAAVIPLADHRPHPPRPVLDAAEAWRLAAERAERVHGLSSDDALVLGYAIVHDLEIGAAPGGLSAWAEVVDARASDVRTTSRGPR